MTLDRYIIPNPAVIGRIVEGEAVLVLSDQGQVKVLNEVGARIWALADGTRTGRDIVAAVCAEYDVTPPQTETDTLDFLAQLVERGIVSLAAQPAQWSNPARLGDGHRAGQRRLLRASQHAGGG